MAKNGDGSASLNEVFTALWDGITAVWNYPIPWESAVKAVGTLFLGIFLMYAGILVAIFLFRFAFWLGMFVRDLLMIAWLLTRRRLWPKFSTPRQQH